MIRFHHITFYFSHHRYLFHDLHGTIPGKGITWVSGPSGRGKSTLFSLIRQRYLPQDGTIVVKGKRWLYDGFSMNDLHLFVDVKLMHLCFILFLSVSFSFIPLDGLLQSLWASQLGMRDSYAFPWVIFLILGIGFVGFFGLGRKLVLYEVSPQIQKLW